MVFFKLTNTHAFNHMISFVPNILSKHTCHIHSESICDLPGLVIGKVSWKTGRQGFNTDGARSAFDPQIFTQPVSGCYRMQRTVGFAHWTVCAELCHLGACVCMCACACVYSSASLQRDLKNWLPHSRPCCTVNLIFPQDSFDTHSDIYIWNIKYCICQSGAESQYIKACRHRQEVVQNQIPDQERNVI